MRSGRGDFPGSSCSASSGGIGAVGPSSITTVAGAVAAGLVSRTTSGATFTVTGAPIQTVPRSSSGATSGIGRESSSSASEDVAKRNALSARAKSFAVENRSAGRLAMARMTSASSLGADVL